MGSTHIERIYLGSRLNRLPPSRAEARAVITLAARTAPETGDSPRRIAPTAAPERRHGDDLCQRIDNLAVAEWADGRSRDHFIARS